LRAHIVHATSLGGTATHHQGFIHILNRHAPWAGYYNYCVDCVISDAASFTGIEAEAVDIHAANGLEKPDYFVARPPALKEKDWQVFLAGKGYEMHEVLFFAAAAQAYTPDDGYQLYRPTENEYLEWYDTRSKLVPAYDAQSFQEDIPLQRRFIKTFRPLWLTRDATMLGFVFCADVDDCVYLFALEINEAFQGQGHGTVFLDLLRGEAGRAGSPQVLLDTTERLRPFYEKAGFAEVSCNTVIRRKRP
jgi:GNAT superfamily N-acetyltransferase